MDHGRQVSGYGDTRAGRGARDESGGVGPRRGGSGESDPFDASGLDQRSDRRGVRGSGRYGPTLARRIHEWRRRGFGNSAIAGTGALEDASGLARRRASSVSPGDQPRQLDAGAFGRRDSRSGGRDDLEIAALQGAAEKGGFRYRRPRHTLKGRQDAEAVDRGGLRLKLFKAQAEAGDIALLFADESEALTHPYLARAWAKRGADLRVPAPGQAQKIAMMGSLDYARRKLIVTTSPTKRSADFIAHLRELDRLYGPKPGAPIKPVVLVLDNGPIHVSKASRASLAERAHWLTVEWLPKYAPELNDIEIVWGDLKSRHLAHQTFTDLDRLDAAIHHAVAELNSARNRDPLDALRISA